MKSKYVVVNYLLEGAAASGAPDTLIDQSKVLTVNPPANMRVMRITFQVYVNGGSMPTRCTISDRIPSYAAEGLILASGVNVDSGGVDVVNTAQYTFENFDNIPIEQTFYVVNSDPNTVSNYLTVIFEGTTIQ